MSKDINMRVKARALGLPAEDYRNDKVLDDDDLLYTGALALPCRLLAQGQGRAKLARRRQQLLQPARADDGADADQPVCLF